MKKSKLYSMIVWAMIVISMIFALSDGMRSGILSDLYISSMLVMRKNGEKLNISFIARENRSEDSGDTTNYACIKGEGYSFTQCIDNAENKLGRRIFLGHLKTIMLEESLLGEDSNYYQLTDYAQRTSYFNHFVRLCLLGDSSGQLEQKITDQDEKINDFLNSIVAEYPLRELYVIKYNEIITSPELFCLPYLKETPSGFIFEGIASIKNDKLAYIYDKNQSIAYRLLINKAKSIYMEVPGGDVSISASRALLTYDENKGFCYDIVLDLILEAYHGKINVQKGGEETLERLLSSYYQNLIAAFTEDCKEKKMDLLGLEKHLYRYHNSVYEQMGAAKARILTESKIDINVKVNIVKNELAD